MRLKSGSSPFLSGVGNVMTFLDGVSMTDSGSEGGATDTEDAIGMYEPFGLMLCDDDAFVAEGMEDDAGGGSWEASFRR